MYFLEIFHIWWLSYISVKFYYRKQYFLAFFPNPLVIPYLVPVEPLFWDVKEICVHTLFSVRNVSHPWLIALLKVLRLICQQILSFFFLPKCLMIYSLTKSDLQLSHHIGSPSHQVTLTSTSECWYGLWKWPLYLPGPLPSLDSGIHSYIHDPLKSWHLFPPPSSVHPIGLQFVLHLTNFISYYWLNNFADWIALLQIFSQKTMLKICLCWISLLDRLSFTPHPAKV